RMKRLLKPCRLDAGSDRIAASTSHPLSSHALFLILITSLVYLQTIRFPFLELDDTPYIVQNPLAQQWSSLPSYFVGFSDPHLAKYLKIPNFYRPVVATWLVMSYKLFGPRPALWHFAAVVLYIFGVWLMWRVARRLVQNDSAALAAALIYAL